MTATTILWAAVAGCVVAGLVAGCATGPGREDTGLRGAGPVPDPLLRRTFTTPRGSTWDFQLGGYWPSDR
jgi:hypothetical protein